MHISVVYAEVLLRSATDVFSTTLPLSALPLINASLPVFTSSPRSPSSDRSRTDGAVACFLCYTSEQGFAAPLMGFMHKFTVHHEQQCAARCSVAMFRKVPHKAHCRVGRRCIGWFVWISNLIRTSSASLKKGTRRFRFFPMRPVSGRRILRLTHACFPRLTTLDKSQNRGEWCSHAEVTLFQQ